MYQERWKTCPACNGRCVIIVHDGPNKAHAERCPICKGTGRVQDYEPYQPYRPWEPYEPWYPEPYYKKSRRWEYWDTNRTSAGNSHKYDSIVIS